MSSFLKIDSTNLVSNGLNNSWRYDFVGSSVNFQDVEVAIQSISLYNSQFNIDSGAFANTSFKLEVPTGATVSILNVSLPDGYYSYADINRVIQTTLVNAGAYLINSTGDNVFYIQLEENSTYYSCQLDVSPTPTSLPVGYTLPATGFILSNTIPQIHPSSSYIVRCDLVKNNYVVSGDILAAFDRGDASIGQLITYAPSQYAWMNTHNGARNSITITIYDQNDRPIHFRDLSVSIMLLFRPKKSLL
ncbi:hypothetical protein PHYSODRAFT_534372 [Phytophthora sojae]|uniref:Uncharacterized protein n=1 Tax=Phytophthora sojae (strain P6497) TaxID=1094619 RepID=G5AGI3_PHYSP|nr:hypothetical protein PHYSODRAFT_534372 [Phytophthora sojae]EGZ05263.1 hypothetical protein PHYSODRAFT_534372 [Phytophthora sojae]|eukprot:XP_009539184.1 hypothetical protein PHYSODRAFT_534372 [Phytophthora sojae]